MSYEAMVVFLVLFLVMAITACVLLYSGSLHWYKLLVKEQEALIKTQRELYKAREDAYWWEQLAKAYKEEGATDEQAV